MTLSDSLDDAVTQETYGLFPVPITRYSLPNHDDIKAKILEWMSSKISSLITNETQFVTMYCKLVQITN